MDQDARNGFEEALGRAVKRTVDRWSERGFVGKVAANCLIFVYWLASFILCIGVLTWGMFGSLMVLMWSVENYGLSLLMGVLVAFLHFVAMFLIAAGYFHIARYTPQSGNAFGNAKFSGARADAEKGGLR